MADISFFFAGVLQESIRTRRTTATKRWAKLRRKSRLSIILSRLNLPRVTLAMVDKLEEASSNFKHWLDTIETAGQRDDVLIVGREDLKTVKKSVKDRFKAKKAWKRARMKTKAIQHWTKADENLQNALREVILKQRSLEAEAGGDE